VGVALSTSQQQFVEEAFKGIVEIRTYKTSEQHTLDLTAGRIDAVFDTSCTYAMRSSAPATRTSRWQARS
jgi:ABC-type amino acid transport substrate-binding protein